MFGWLCNHNWRESPSGSHQNIQIIKNIHLLIIRFVSSNFLVTHNYDYNSKN